MDLITSKLSKLNLQPVEPIAGSDIAHNPVDLFKSYISAELSRVSGIDKTTIFPALEWTNTPDRGDLVLAVPRIYRVKGGPKPDDLAKEWAEKFEKSKFLDVVSARGSFVQFFFGQELLKSIIIPEVLSKRSAFGKCKVGEGKTVVVEFSSPNIAKPFHAGHLRSTIIGGFIANLYEALGWKVIRLNYLGDWGKQFGVLAVGFARYGSEEKLVADPINHLFEVYVSVNKDITDEKEASEDKATSKTDDEARAFFKKMEGGDQEALALWKRFRSLSIAKYRETYGRLNITYDDYSGESTVSLNKMEEVLKVFKETGLAHEDRGALLIDLAKHNNKKLGKCLVQKSDGTTLYMTRDVGGAIERYEKYKFDKMIYVIASQQDLHVAQFFKILELSGYEFAKKLEHISFGMVEGMSTRKGTVVFLDNILDETKDAMHEVMRQNEDKYAQIENPDEIANLVGISAVVIQDMKAKRVNNYKFDWKRMLSFEGDTGPYLQYAHSRMCSVERKAANSGLDISKLSQADFSLITEPIGGELTRLLAQWPSVILNAAKNSEPSTIVTYLFKLSHTVSSCYDVLWVAGQEENVALARLALYSAARQVLNNGMKLLNLTPVERM